jgi:hypothetical protein
VKFVVFKLAFVDVLISHNKLAFNSLIIVPRAFKGSIIRPAHFAKAGSFVKFPMAFINRRLEVHNDFIKLINYHFALPTPFSVFQHSRVLVSAHVIYLAISE